MPRRLIAAIACRNQGSRLYAKPLQNLDVERGVTILDNILACLETVPCIDDIVLGISDGEENDVYRPSRRGRACRTLSGIRKTSSCG